MLNLGCSAARNIVIDLDSGFCTEVCFVSLRCPKGNSVRLEIKDTVVILGDFASDEVEFTTGAE